MTRSPGATADADTSIRLACAYFLARVRLAVPVSNLTVVLLGPGDDASRVVFAWSARSSFSEAQPQPRPILARADLPGPADEPIAGLVLSPPPHAPAPVVTSDNHSSQCGSTMNLPLRGRGRTLGAVLFQNPSPGGYSPDEKRLAQRLADQLAPHLENIRLRQQIEQKALETQVMDRIAEAASSGAPTDRVYRQFAAEVKRLVDYHRLSIYLTDLGADLLTCAYCVGEGVRRRKPGVTCKLSATRYGAVALGRRSHIIADLLETAEPVCLEGVGLTRTGGKRLRSAVIVPVVYADSVIGAIALEHRTPRSYGPAEEKLLQRAAAYLGPPVANSSLYAELTRKAQELSAIREEAQRRAREITVTAQAVRILASNRPLQEVFGCFAGAVSRLVSFHHATLSWIDPNGYDIQTVQASPGPESDARTPCTCALEATSRFKGQRIQTPLLFQGKNIGVLTLWSCRDGAFTIQEQESLDRLAGQTAAAVQNARLYQQARRQAYQLEQLLLEQPSSPSFNPSSGSDNGATALQPERLPPPGPPYSGAVYRRPDSLRRELLTEAAHSLRTPLTAIKGYSSTLLQNDVSWSLELQREFLETIDRETDRLNQVVTDLLAPAHAETGAVPLQPAVSTVEDLLRQAGSRLKGDPTSHPVQFSCDPGLPLVLVDQSRLAQVIVHLVRCADRVAAPGATLLVEARRGVDTLTPSGVERATPSAEPVPSLSRGSGQAGSELAWPLVSVGPAWSHSDGEGLRRLSVPQHEDSGTRPEDWEKDDLRLIVCRALLEAQGVTLHTGPAEGDGARFWFTLPVAGPSGQG